MDDFKKINDSLGHESGDELLTEAARRLSSVIREADTVGRLGGDEFIVILGGLKDEVEAQPIVENLLNRFREAFYIDGRKLMITASVGIAMYPSDGTSSSELLRNADSAMYHSKKMGRNTFAYFTQSMNKKAQRRLALEEQIHGALERHEFSVFYQPKIAFDSGKIMGAEALLRWNNPALGSVSPVEFIPVAEQSGLIMEIGKFVLNTAIKQTIIWQEKIKDFQIAVNLSPIQFRDPELIVMLKEYIEVNNFLAKTLELEITEGVLLTEHSYVDTVLREISAMGILLAMDDFGTGYSSLSYLRKYPFDILKIDRSFVSDMIDDPEDRELIQATISMSKALNLKVVAEGVETQEQFDTLEGFGCHYSQGYLFSKPVETEAFTLLIDKEVGGK